MTSEAIDTLTFRCPQLRSLMLADGSRIQFSDELLQRTATRCPFLESIRISDGVPLQGAGIRALGQAGRLRHLKVDVLGYGGPLHANYFTAMADILPLNPNLHTLESPADLSLMRRIATHAPQLQNLAVSMRRVWFQTTAALMEGLWVIAQSCTQLRTLRVEYGIADRILVALGAHCPHLTALTTRFSLYGGTTVTDVGVCALAEGCPQLRELSTIISAAHYVPSDFLAAPVSMVGITALATHCPHLRELGVHRSVVPSHGAAGATTIVIGRLHVTVHYS
jgi:hypothetical protein